MVKIVITGPESSGKTTLSTALADHFGVSLVQEMAREYLINAGGMYEMQDLDSIALEQVRAEDKIISENNRILLCDTDILTIKIWAEDKFGRSSKMILDLMARNRVDLYLLCHPDIPWEPDPLRENPHDRDRILDIYKKELESYRYRPIFGSHDDRLRSAIGYVKSLLDA